MERWLNILLFSLTMFCFAAFLIISVVLRFKSQKNPDKGKRSKKKKW